MTAVDRDSYHSLLDLPIPPTTLAIDRPRLCGQKAPGANIVDESDGTPLSKALIASIFGACLHGFAL